MASPFDIPGGVPADNYADLIQTQRQQMLSQALMQGALSPSTVEQPQAVKGLYVQPRVGGLQIAGKLANALLAGRANDRAMQSQVNLMRGLNAQYAPGGQPVPGTGVPLQAPTSPTDPNEQSVQPAIARNPGQSLAQTVQNSQPQYTPTNPRNPSGLPADVVRNLAMTNPEAYSKYLQGPEAVQLGRIAGVDPATAARAALTKSTAIEARPGGTVMDLISGRTMIGADPSKGEYYAVGPDGQVHAFPITNDATIQAWRQGLNTAATQANTPREVPMGGDVTALRYPGQVPGLGNPPALQGGTPGQNPTSPNFAPGGNAPVQSTPAGPGAGSGPGGAISGLAGSVRPPQQSQPPQNGIWSTVPKLQIPNTPGQTTDAYHQALLTNAAAKHQELLNNYGQAADLADQKLQYNQDARKYLASAEVGPASEWLTENRARLAEWGVPASLIPGDGAVTPTMELNKNLKQSALQGARQVFGSRMTQMEVRLQHEELSPSTSMTRDAIGSLLQQDDIKQNYAKQRAQDYSQYAAAGGDPTQFETWYNRYRPLTRFAAQAQTPPAALQRLQQQPQTLRDFQAKYGWDPTQ